MQLRGRGNVIAIALSGLAVVLAVSGTAYAVTATTVNIADPTTPTRIAKVDAGGHLFTNDLKATTTINIEESLYSFSSTSYALSTPTTATLAVTELAYDNANNRKEPNTDYDAQLIKINVGSTGNCVASGATDVGTYRADSVPQGASTGATFPQPLVFKPTGTTAYCIGVLLSPVDATAPTTVYGVETSVGAYVVAGSYTGTGTSAQPARLGRPLTRKAPAAH